MTVRLVIANLGITREYHSGAQLDLAVITYRKNNEQTEAPYLKEFTFFTCDYMSKIPQDSIKSDLLHVKHSSGNSE